jgi:Flp pilus assembly protein TadG
VAIITAFVIVPLTLAIGIAVDASRIFLVRSRLSQAADSAALAAAQVTDPTTLQDDARRMFAANFPSGYMDSSMGPLNVSYDDASGRVEVTAEATVPTILMRLATIDNVDVGAHAAAVREVKPLELALVLDVTGSMCDPCSKIDALQAAGHDLLDILFGTQETSAELAVAVVPFSARVKIGTSHTGWVSGSGSWGGCVEMRSGTLALSDAPPSSGKFPKTVPVSYQTCTINRKGKKTCTTSTVTPPCPASRVTPLTDQKSVAGSAIDALATGGTTRIDMGAEWGRNVLSERWRGLWGHAGWPRSIVTDKITKAVVLMTDGENNTDSTYDETDDAGADQNVRDLCQSMKNDGWIIYTVGFESPTSARSMLQACASGPSNFFESPTEDDLRAVFRQIAGRLSALRLVE